MKARAGASTHAQSGEAAPGWLAPLRDWPQAAADAVRRDGTVARVVVADLRGSAPRDPGTSMLVERSRILGTIGGGQLEWAAIEAARSLLDDLRAPSARVEKLVLGTQLAQCCGGVVELWIERYGRADLPFLIGLAHVSRDREATLCTTLAEGRVERRLLRSGVRASRLVRAGEAITWFEPLAESLTNVWIYGAGHVGQALVRVLADLPVRIAWIDSRTALLPQDAPDFIRIMPATDPLTTVSQAPAGAFYVVMTHSHPLDYNLCRAILERGDQSWVGVIGSHSKAARFRSRLARDGLAATSIERLVCPIGIEGVRSKVPAAIAVAVAAQLLTMLESNAEQRPAQAHAFAQHVCSGADESGSCAACDLRIGK